jgi:hypothetical protein
MAIWWEAIEGWTHWCLEILRCGVSSPAQSLGSAGDYESYHTGLEREELRRSLNGQATPQSTVQPWSSLKY